MSDSFPPIRFSRRRLLAAGAAGCVLPLSFASAVAPAAPADPAGAWQPATLPQGLQRDIASTITGQRYRIYLNVPATPPPAAGHPVLYALDGNASFPALALMARTAASRSRETGQAAPVVVGIGYPSGQDFGGGRTRDYTPPSADAPAGEGGADRFLDFIERELKPLVAALAPLDLSRQALFGHSYGGLCTLHALFTRPAMFQAYLASSPSIWYRERAVLGGLAGLSQRLAALPARPGLMLAAGEHEQPAAGAALSGRQALAARRRMVDEARELAASLQSGDQLARVRFHLLAGEDHGSAMFPAMARGFEFFLA